MLNIAVIGLGWGDEGKGAVTQSLAACAHPTQRVRVIRFNGGAQAAHTVVHQDVRHVCSHIGSGSLLGVPTHLTQDFYVNPILWDKEMKVWNKRTHGQPLRVTCDPDALVTTPFDMHINHVKHKINRHGTCGAGVFETMYRSTNPSQRLSACHLYDSHELRRRLDAICIGAKSRLAELAFRHPEVAGCENFDRDAVCQAFFESVNNMLSAIKIQTSHSFEDDVHIYEGAQGLMLDQNRQEFFPHLTPSNTGLQNVLRELDGSDCETLYVVFVTRPYTTRHGNGPLPYECQHTFKDETNVSNEFQGSLRFGTIDLDRIENAIQSELATAKALLPRLNVIPRIALTCYDQMPSVQFYRNGRLEMRHAFDFKDELHKIAPVAVIGNGPALTDYTVKIDWLPKERLWGTDDVDVN